MHGYEDAGDIDITKDVKPSKVDWKTFPVAACPWTKKINDVKTKTNSGGENRILVVNFSEDEIKVVQLLN